MGATPTTINYLTEIRFGAGAVEMVAERLADLGVANPLVVTDPGVRGAGLLDRLGLPNPAVFDGVPANPTERSVEEGVAGYRAAGCDGIVALGGGSPLDCAKGISLMVSHPGPLEQYAVIRGGLDKITGDMPPLIAVPTTAGTGSEVGRAALLGLTDGTKLGFLSPHMIPTVAVCDPVLTVGLPPLLTAATGMDAISHCVETFCSPRYNPVAESIALDGLTRAFENLPIAVARGERIEPRSEMMMAALQGGLTFQKGLGLIHSLSHPLGALAGKSLHHGTLNAIFLPHVLRFNREACPGKLERLASAIGMDRPDGLADAFDELRERIGLPGTLRDLGLTKEDLASVIPDAIADHSSATNPAPVDAVACAAVLDAAYQ